MVLAESSRRSSKPLIMDSSPSTVSTRSGSHSRASSDSHHGKTRLGCKKTKLLISIGSMNITYMFFLFMVNECKFRSIYHWDHKLYGFGGISLVFHSKIQQTKLCHMIFTYQIDYCIDVFDDFRLLFEPDQAYDNPSCIAQFHVAIN